MAANPYFVTDSLTSTTNGSPFNLKSGYLTLSGTWAGTVNLQTLQPDKVTWVNVTDGSGNAIAFTGNVNCPIDNPIAIPMRVNLTYTSGTLVATITAGPLSNG